MMFRSILSIIVLCIIFVPPIAMAAKENGQEIDMGALGPSAPKKQVAKKVERTYEQITYENLIKLAWSYDAYSVENHEDLNAYIIITECNLYNRFFHNEFEWEKIRIATKEFLRNNKDKVPRYYEYVQPIVLERYDYSLQGFPIVGSETTLKGQKNLQFASFAKGVTECGAFDLGDVNYPSTGVVTITSPLNLTFIRVPIKLAQQYIDWRARLGIATTDNRQAYIRYRIRIDAYEGIKTFEHIDAYNFRGKLMRLDVFADPEMMLPLYNQVF